MSLWNLEFYMRTKNFLSQISQQVQVGQANLPRWPTESCLVVFQIAPCSLAYLHNVCEEYLNYKKKKIPPKMNICFSYTQIAYTYSYSISSTCKHFSLKQDKFPNIPDLQFLNAKFEHYKDVVWTLYLAQTFIIIFRKIQLYLYKIAYF